MLEASESTPRPPVEPLEVSIYVRIFLKWIFFFLRHQS